MVHFGQIVDEIALRSDQVASAQILRDAELVSLDATEIEVVLHEAATPESVYNI